MFNYKQLRAPSLTNFDFWVPISYVLWKVWTKMNIRGLWHAMFNSLVKITLAASVQQNISLIKIIKLQVTWLLNNFRLWSNLTLDREFYQGLVQGYHQKVLNLMSDFVTFYFHRLMPIYIYANCQSVTSLSQKSLSPFHTLGLVNNKWIFYFIFNFF